MGKHMKGPISILKRWQRRHRNTAGDTAALPEQSTFSAAVPVGQHGPLCRIDLQWIREPQQDGERLRLRAHLQTNFASVLRPALRQSSESRIDVLALPGPGGRLTPARRVGREAARLTTQGLQKLLATPLAQRLTEPLLRHDFNTWVEIQASTEPLDEGARSLLPAPERLAALGIVPGQSQGQGPVAESWTGSTPTGHAQLSLLQIDKSNLPPDLARRMGRQPFQLAAAIVNTVERR